ncbi:DUF350 domain-containing protein [Tropicibacter naphthalenivorans]|uniref:Putative membrane protein n=1 Tax=Tropicibacter naphthalenivorans TaxID=441103 RepID=A0A0N7M178_9RHOB|nr:DUF350 domain-containing protein [Tropicibacter naphthalenivorans]CUH82505.1 putative membrane protein [Tropicibacter naphthalenivorans]SMD06916.1 protein of unknown function [Tropicibacter naphthalenivorans]
MDLSQMFTDIISTIVFTSVGAIMMYIVWKVIDWATPFEIIKEIEEDQNIALAILFGFLFLSIAIIIAAVILS